ncbi:MAG TPA: hypothetical protein VFM94_05735 [Solirubrobacterales bacterium]|nr:hypothetical protein [Solirubrobacterales bacterium]
MVIHDRFVFLHVPKTGGRFIRRFLLQAFPSCRFVDEQHPHFGWNKLPEEAVGRPVLAFIRNPWDWYVSWYSFISGQPAPPEQSTWHVHPLVRGLFIKGSNVGVEGGPVAGSEEISDFATTVRRACGGIVDGGGRAELERVTQGYDLAKPLLEGHDLYTAQVETVLGAGLDSDLLTIGRFESLTADLESFVERVGLEMPEGEPGIKRAKPVNTSRRAPYREYYDPELRDLVGASCRALIERFDYRF